MRAIEFLTESPLTPASLFDPRHLKWRPNHFLQKISKGTPFVDKDGNQYYPSGTDLHNLMQQVGNLLEKLKENPNSPLPSLTVNIEKIVTKDGKELPGKLISVSKFEKADLQTEKGQVTADVNVQPLGIGIAADPINKPNTKPKDKVVLSTEEEIKREYQEYVDYTEKHNAEFEEIMKSGAVIKAYVITGYNAGKYVPIKLKSDAAKVIVETAAGNTGDLDITKEITGIKKREERNKELDAEKVFQAIREHALNDDELPANYNHDFDNAHSLKSWSELMTYANPFNSLTKDVLIALLYNSIGYRFKRKLNEKLFNDTYPDDEKVYEYFFEKGSEFGPVKTSTIVQFFIRDNVFTNAEGSPTSNLANRISVHLAENIFEKDVQLIRIKQEEIAAQRNDRVNKRIEALTKKLSTAG
jgi:hypothetical protein